MSNFEKRFFQFTPVPGGFRPVYDSHGAKLGKKKQKNLTSVLGKGVYISFLAVFSGVWEGKVFRLIELKG